MEDIFNYLIIGLIIYGLLSGFLKKQKPKAEPPTQPLPETPFPSEKSEGGELQIDWKDFFKIEDEEVKKTETEVFKPESSFQPTTMMEMEKRDDKYKFKEITPIQSFRTESIEYKEMELQAAYIESQDRITVFEYLFPNGDEVRRAFIYREIFDRPISLRKKLR